jgi:hypothetical protein
MPVSQADVERDADSFRPHLLQDVAQKPREAIQRMRGVAVRIDHIRRHGMIGAKHEEAGVDEVHDT